MAEVDGSSMPDHGPEGTKPRSTRDGFGRVLVVVYAVFAVAATARSAVQIATRFDEAPVAYLLSAVAAAIYIVATIALARGDRTSRRVATVAITIELIGVLSVGVLSLLIPSEFPAASVWSSFGSGYLFIPLVLPLVGLWWLRRIS
jgi:cytochrome bd-type quinol oxidase subunit 2